MSQLWPQVKEACSSTSTMSVTCWQFGTHICNHQYIILNSLMVGMQTKLPLHFARRNATWLLTQLAHLLLQEEMPEQSGV
jgi:hypothetical protein